MIRTKHRDYHLCDLLKGLELTRVALHSNNMLAKSLVRNNEALIRTIRKLEEELQTDPIHPIFDNNQNRVNETNK